MKRGFVAAKNMLNALRNKGEENGFLPKFTVKLEGIETQVKCWKA